MINYNAMLTANRKLRNKNIGKTIVMNYDSKSYIGTWDSSQGHWKVSCSGEEIGCFPVIRPNEMKKYFLHWIAN